MKTKIVVNMWFMPQLNQTDGQWGQAVSLGLFSDEEVKEFAKAMHITEQIYPTLYDVTPYHGWAQAYGDVEADGSCMLFTLMRGLFFNADPQQPVKAAWASDPLDARQIVQGMTVTSDLMPDLVGAVYGYHRNGVSVIVGWIKWDPKLHAPMMDFQAPAHLTFKAYGN